MFSGRIPTVPSDGHASKLPEAVYRALTCARSLSLASKSIAWASKAMFRSTSKRKQLLME